MLMRKLIRRPIAKGLLAALAACSLFAGSAFAAPPAKNAERKCVDAGGQFVWEVAQYRCDGLSGTAVIASAERQCRNSYKGWSFSWWQDQATGMWSYICSR
jgi:hypothetical protein